MTVSLIHFQQLLTNAVSMRAVIDAIAMESRTLVFIEPYGSAISMLNYARAKKYNIVILTANIGMRKVTASVIESAQLSIQVDTLDDDAVLTLLGFLANHMLIDAIIPGFEYFVPLSAYASEMLGLPGTSPDSIMYMRDKAQMRRQLLRAGVNMPEFYHVTSMNELQAAMNAIRFPAVCKPIDAAGSVHVRKVQNEMETLDAAKNILQGENELWGYVLSREMLLEEYIEGREYSVEGVITNGEIEFFSVTEKIVNNQSEFIEIGHIVNPPMCVDEVRKIEYYVARVIAVLKPDNCPFHAELRIRSDGEPVLMEIAARLAGDRIGDLIGISRSMNFLDFACSSYLGVRKYFEHTDACPTGIRFFYRPGINQFSSISGLEFIEKAFIEELQFYYEPHTFIPAFPKPLRRLGHVIIKDHDYEKLKMTLTLIDECIQFHP